MRVEVKAESGLDPSASAVPEAGHWRGDFQAGWMTGNGRVPAYVGVAVGSLNRARDMIYWRISGVLRPLRPTPSNWPRQVGITLRRERS